MEKIDCEVDDFMNYCDYKGVSPKSMKSYEQTLRLYERYSKDECNITNTGDVKEQTIKKYLILIIHHHQLHYDILKLIKIT